MKVLVVEFDGNNVSGRQQVRTFSSGLSHGKADGYRAPERSQKLAASGKIRRAPRASSWQRPPGGASWTTWSLA
jgi:hypothetical protein